jgi:hypothetical protein
MEQPKVPVRRLPDSDDTLNKATYELMRIGIRT